MSFADAISKAMGSWFAGGFADTVTLNGAATAALVYEQSDEERPDGLVAVIDIEFKLADYASVNYATDTAIVFGVTWRYPRQIWADGFTRMVRFAANARARARR